MISVLEGLFLNLLRNLVILETFVFSVYNTCIILHCVLGFDRGDVWWWKANHWINYQACHLRDPSRRILSLNMSECVSFVFVVKTKIDIKVHLTPMNFLRPLFIIWYENVCINQSELGKLMNPFFCVRI